MYWKISKGGANPRCQDRSSIKILQSPTKHLKAKLLVSTKYVILTTYVRIKLPHPNITKLV